MSDRIIDIGGVPLRVEEIGAWLTLDYSHEKIHLGEMFYFDNYGTIGNGGTLQWLITCGTIENLHAEFGIDVSGAFRIYLFNNSAGSAGTAIPLWNLNRASSNTCSATVVHTPTVTDAGSAIMDGRYIPAGAGVAARIGGGLRGGAEVVLDAGKKYLYRAVNISGAAGTVSFYGEVYEEGDE